MQELIVKSQQELNAVKVDYNGRIIIKLGEPYNRAIVKKRYRYSVVARDNSHVVAWGNSHVEARDNSHVVARGNSHVVARDNSHVEARDNSHVEAWDNSHVVAWGNVQVVDAARKNNVKINGNARVVYNPSTIEEWAETNGITIQDGKIRLYKAVHKVNNQLIADWDRSFEYIPGKTAIADGFNSDPEEDCGKGIHMATLAWAAMYGQAWDDMALLELEAAASEVIVPLYETGKVRAPKALVIREVPLEEAGLMGKIIAKRRKS